MRRPTPPRIARWILGRVLAGPTRHEILEDLEQIWNERSASAGTRAANRWYWSQLMRALWARSPGPSRGRSVATATEGVRDSMRRDIAHALRQLRRHPAVGIVVVLTLAVGIGSATAIFSVVHAVLLEPLPYDEPAGLVMVTSEAGGSTLPRHVSGPDVSEMPQAVTAFSEVAAFMEATVGPMTEVDRPEHVITAPVTWNLFHLLGVHVALGRDFNRDDAIPVQPNATDPPPVSAIISDGLWQRSFGGDPGVIGRVVHIWGGATQIVGVLPERLQLVVPPALNIPADGDVWRAIRWDIASWSREWRWLRTVARLADQGSVHQAQEQADRFARDLRTTHPHHAAEETRFRVTSLEAAVAAPMRGPLWLLMGAVTLVLLIACANVANLLLARGAARAREMAIRSSLGAGRDRLVRQLITESFVMAMLGAGGGVLLAYVGLDFLHAVRPADLHRLADVRLDLPVMGFTAVIAVTTVVLSGVLPAYHTTRGAMTGYIRTRSGSEAARRSRSLLVVSEVALSVALLVGAGLLIRTFSELQRMPLGFEPEGVLTVTATQSQRPRSERQVYEADLMRAAASVPGVTAAGIVFPLPMNGVYERTAEYAMNGTETDPTAWIPVYFRTVSPTYFETMGLDLQAGRHFVDSDENYDVPVVILDDRLAAREFPGHTPVGEPLWVRGMEGDTLRAEIIGVVEHSPQRDHWDIRPTMYFPRVFYQSHEVSVVAKVEGDPSRVAPRLSQAIRGVDPSFPSDLVPMERYVQDRLARSRFLVILMQIFSVLALGLSAVGLYGVLSYTVRQRRKELGLRMALGAAASKLTGNVVWSGMRLALAGIAIGLAGSLLAAQGLRSQLFRVGATDPLALAGSAAVVLAVAVFSSLIPALQASRIHPVVALQEEEN